MNTIHTLPDNFHKALYEVITPRDPQTGKRTTRAGFKQSNSLPILSHVLIRTHEGRLSIYSYSLDDDKTPALVYHCPARIDDDLQTCAPALPLLRWMDIIKNDPESITLQHDPNCELLHIYAGNAHATFKCIDAQEFPSIADATESGTASDPVITTTALACDRDSMPEYATLHHVGGLLIGTDGVRMHTSPSTEAGEDSPFAQNVTALLDRTASPIYTAYVNGAALLKAAKNLWTIAKRGDGFIHFSANGTLRITAKNADDDESTVDLPLLNSTGGKVEFDLPVSHVLDALAHVDPKQKREKGRPAPEPRAVAIRFTSWDAPIILAADDRRAYIMPRTVIPSHVGKPSKSELMSAYNRKRAEYRKQGRSLYALNAAFGKLQSRAWNVGEMNNTTFHLLRSIIDARPAEIAIPATLDTVVHL